MTDNIIHASETGFIVGSSPNVNAVYGPWRNVDEAQAILESYFVTFDDNWEQVPNVPAGTTVAVYNSDKQDLVTEYWWVKNSLVLKTYGNNYYELVVKDTFDRIVNSIVIKDGFTEPDLLKVSCIDSSTGETVQFGRVNYSINGGDFETYSFNSNGIPTNNIKTSIVFEWRDDEGRLILFKDLNVIAPATITLNFYAYTKDLEQPEYITGEESLDYLTSQWTPNLDILTSEDWVTKRRGVSSEFPTEWVISRTRINGVWEPIQGPVISASFGKDGANVTNQQYLWTYSIYNDLSTNLKSTILNLNSLTADQLKELYEVEDVNGNRIIWYSKFLSLTPENRYCYITHRYKQEIDGVMVWSSWADPAIYTVYPLDGEDSPTTEYIYCQSDSEVLGESEMIVFNWINLQYSTNLEDEIVGGEIDFQNINYWAQDPKGVSSTKRFEFAAIREKQINLTGVCVYGKFSTPFIWAAFGKEGPDGPGLEYIYKLSSKQPDLVKASGDEYQLSGYTPDGWSDKPLEVSYGHPILWMSLRKKVNGLWEDFSVPVIWNLFNLTYTLVLSNENCSIPSSADGSYTLEAARAATVTKVTLYLGSEDVTDQAVIQAEGYTNEGGNYYLIDTSYDFTTATNINFTAKIDGEQVASKFLTVSLNKGAESYMLQCVPNNRIWYGGDSYSATNFQLMLYKINAAGLYEQINDLSNFEYTYLFSNSTELIEADAHSNITIQGGESSSIYLTLYNKVEEGKRLIIDSVTISCVDYSTIKGADNVSVVFGGIEKNIDIPITKALDTQYIKNRTKSIPKAYINTIEIPSDKLEISAELIYFDAIISDSIKIDPVDGAFWFGQPLIGDASIIYTIKVTMEDGSILEYFVSQFLNLTADKIVYDLHPDINIITYGDAGFSSETINFTLVASEGDIPNYTIKYRINDLEKGQIEDNTETYLFNLSDNIKNVITEGTYTLFFELYVLDVLKDTTSVTIISEPRLAGYNYTIDLDNPHLLIPVGTTGELLLTWSTSQFTVYLADHQILATGEEYPKYSILVLDSNRDYVFIENNKVYLTTLPASNTIINYTVTILESENISYDFIKSQRILLVNDVAYQLISNPNKIVTTHDGSGSITYTPIINKIVNGEVINITDLQKELLEILVGKAPALLALSIPIAYNPTTTSLLISLKKKTGELLDSDTLPVIRSGAPGADGLSVKYVYGLSKDNYITEDQLEHYSDKGNLPNKITTYTKESFESKYPSDGNKIFTDSLGIQWYDNPRGVSSTYKQEFQSVSTYNGDTWSLFSSPTVYSELGEKGEDGDGVLYFYTACLSLEVDGEQYTIVSSKGTFTGSLAYDLMDPIELEGWLDNIPNLSRDNPKLFMTLRKKVQGLWSKFLNPILWNSYHSELELVIDNNVVIIDDNSTTKTVQQVSTTNVKAYYLGSEIELTEKKFKYSISKELSNIIDVSRNNNVCHITIKDGQSLSPTSGQITYSIEYNDVTVTAALLVLIKDFSAGEVYKLVLSPNVLPLTFEDGKYKWDNTDISITALKISGKVSEDVTNSVTIRLNGENILLLNKKYTISAGTNSNTPQFIFDIVKDNIVIESLTLLGTLQGKDGLLGESGATFRLRGEWNSRATYYYKGGENTGDSYIDVVFIIEGSKKSFYLAKKLNSGVHPSNDDNWKEAPSYDTLLSENILISDGDKISGGMVNKATTNKTILWAGGNGEDTDSSSANAAFRVTEDGTLYASKGVFEGMYLSKVKEVQDFKLSTRVLPEYVYYQIIEGTDTWEAIMPPVLDISELSDNIIISKHTRISKRPTGLQFPMYTYDANTYELQLKMVDLFIEGPLTIELPNGIYLNPYDTFGDGSSDMYPLMIELYNTLPVSMLDDIIERSVDGTTHHIQWNFENILTDAFFNYMIYLVHCKYSNDPTESHLPISELRQGTNNIFDVVLEYQAFKYTQALSFINKTISITNAFEIRGCTNEITPLNKFYRYEDNTLFLTEATSTKDGWLAGSLGADDMYTFSMYRVPIEDNTTDIPVNGEGGKVLYGYLDTHYENGEDTDDSDRQDQANIRTAVALSIIHCFSFDDIFTTEDGQLILNPVTFDDQNVDKSLPLNYGYISDDYINYATDKLNYQDGALEFRDSKIIWTTKPVLNAYGNIEHPEFYTRFQAGVDKYSPIYGTYGIYNFAGEFLSWKQVSETRVGRKLRNSLDDKLGRVNDIIDLTLYEEIQ